jgi:uncharacterized protein (DUF4415 family)
MPKPQLIDDDGEVRGLGEADLRRFKSAAEALPATLRKKLGVRGPQKRPTKVPTTIRFDADVLAALKASGKGWQTRVNDALRDWLKTRSAV